MLMKIVPRSKAPSPLIASKQAAWANAVEHQGQMFDLEYYELHQMITTSAPWIKFSADDCVPVIDVTDENVLFCIQAVSKMDFLATRTKSYKDMVAVIKNEDVSRREFFDQVAVNSIYGLGTTMAWVYTFIRDNQAAFTKEVQHD